MQWNRRPFSLCDFPFFALASPSWASWDTQSCLSQASACPSGINLLCVWLKIGIRFHFLNVRDLLLASPATCVSVLP